MVIVRRLLIVLVLLALIIVGIALVSPGTVNIERSIRINAPQATVFALANDFRNSEKWSPWSDIAPDVTEVEFSGSERGVGAIMTWESEDAQVGSGSQRITLSEPFRTIETALSFEGQGEAATGLALRRVDEQTEVTWSYRQEFGLSIPGRLIGRFLDGWIGPDYERGLARLKALAERLPSTDFAGLGVVEVDVSSVQLASVVTQSEPTTGAISQALGQAFYEVLSFIRENELQQAGAPLKISIGLTDVYRFQAAIPVTGNATSGPRVKLVESYSGPALKVSHTGPYAMLSETHYKVQSYMAALGYTPAGPEWESYVSDPQDVPVEELRTEIFYPIKP